MQQSQDTKIFLELRSKTDFLDYLRILKTVLRQYVIFIVVCDTGTAPYFQEQHATAMRDLGLNVDMTNRYRQPYIAIINKGEVLTELVSERIEIPLTVCGKLNEHELFVYSAGYMCQTGIGVGAKVMFDGTDFMLGSRGFNFLVFDSDKDKIIDNCSFDTFDMNRKTEKYNQLESALSAFNEKYRGVQLCTLELPRFPQKGSTNLSEWEKFIQIQHTKDNNWIKFIATSKVSSKEAWDKKLFPFCYDFEHFEDMWQSFQVPQSFLNLQGVRQFADQTSSAVNTSNGVRVTLYQPTCPKRSIFLIGICKLYGWGSDDAHTPATLLQQVLNLKAANNGFIVYNYSYVCGGTRMSIGEMLGILRTIPFKQGDIVLLMIDGEPVWGIPHCNLSLKSVRPHNYGEIFIDRHHYSKNGNRMISNGIFEFLYQHNFFKVKNYL